MDLQRRDEFKQRLFELTPADGGALVNAALRDALQNAYPNEAFSLDDYWDLRNSLIDEGKLEKGRGRGGLIWRIVAARNSSDEMNVIGAATSLPDAALTQEVVTESSLYEPFQKCIQIGYVPDNDLKPWICEVTASQGRRNTGGLWTRPDVTLIAMQTFPYVLNKNFDVVTFEIKPSIETAMEGVYECAAHSAFANRSYLAFPDSDEYENSPLFKRISDECERLGLGLILFGDVENWDTYNLVVSAKRNTPDLGAVNNFIKLQISERSREEIQRWFR